MTFDLSITGGLFVLAIIGTIFWLTRKKKTNRSTDQYQGHKQADASLSPAYHGIKPGSNGKSSRKESHRSARRVPTHRNDEDLYASELMFMDHTLSKSTGRGYDSGGANGGSGYAVPTPGDNSTDTSSSPSGDGGGGGGGE